MALLAVASQCHPSELLHVLHFNHQSREGNKEDEKLVQNFCSKLNIPCTIKCLNKAKTSQNLEQYWRTERQEYSIKLATEIKVDRILTAHHATDLVETMIFRLAKGCGVGGLSPFDRSTKPFWSLPKTDLIEYAQDHKLTWHEDPSNDDTHHQRNLIRHQVLPQLRKITPNLEKVFVSESIIFGEIDAYLKDQIAKIKDQKSDNCYLVSDICSLPKALQREILRSITKKTPSFDEMEDFFKWIENEPQGGSQKDLGGTRFSVQAGLLKWIGRGFSQTLIGSRPNTPYPLNF
ncbi:MAG TPA: tRNA lysidine(34) synthetase TilS, partial [Candidatus Gracilibacteria bacterium]